MSSTPVIELDSTPDLEAAREYSYSVKIINPAQKKAFSVRKLRVQMHFSSLETLKEQLIENFNDLITDPYKLEFGYIGPGHGSRGKQNWITADEDVEDMYEEYNSKHRKDIMLWFYAGDTTSHKSTKQKRSRSPLKKHSNYQAKLEKVELILGRLKEKHAATYSEERLRAWAHLIEMEKHSSYDEPPNTPFFAGKGLKTAKLASDAARSSTTGMSSSNGVSPSKRLIMHSQCIEQLDRWHTLLEKGCITQADYDEMHGKIMADMKNI